MKYYIFEKSYGIIMPSTIEQLQQKNSYTITAVIYEKFSQQKIFFIYLLFFSSSFLISFSLFF